MSNGRKLSEAQDIAVTDYLTGLPNSRSLYLHLDEELARSRRNGSSLGVLLCDLDGFKKINDEHGHLDGDHVLKAVAAALKQSCRSYDYVARMGGDEFVVVLPDTEAAEVEESVVRFRATVERAGMLLGFPGLSLSIGANALSHCPDDVSTAADADAILAEADKRMYADKRRRKAAQVLEMPRLTRVPANRQTPVNPAADRGLPVAISC